MGAILEEGVMSRLSRIWQMPHGPAQEKGGHAFHASKNSGHSANAHDGHLWTCNRRRADHFYNLSSGKGLAKVGAVDGVNGRYIRQVSDVQLAEHSAVNTAPGGLQ